MLTEKKNKMNKTKKALVPSGLIKGSFTQDCMRSFRAVFCDNIKPKKIIFRRKEFGFYTGSSSFLGKPGGITGLDRPREAEKTH